MVFQIGLRECGSTSGWFTIGRMIFEMRLLRLSRSCAMRRTPSRLAICSVYGISDRIAGVRLNIGLVYYRQNDVRNTIPSFESVVRDAPDSFQARYLLGLCYFFVERYGDAANTFEPLWSQASGQLNYL